MWFNMIDSDLIWFNMIDSDLIWFNMIVSDLIYTGFNKTYAWVMIGRWTWLFFLSLKTS